MQAMGHGLVFSAYPHRNFEFATRTLWDWSRTFIGRCLPGGRNAVVSFGAERRDVKAKWERSVAWAYVVGESLSMHSAKPVGAVVPSFAAVVKATHDGTCREIRQFTYDEPY